MTVKMYRPVLLARPCPSGVVRHPYGPSTVLCPQRVLRRSSPFQGRQGRMQVAPIIDIMVADDEILATLEPREHPEQVILALPKAECEVAEVVDDIFIANDGVPPFDDVFIMLSDRREGTRLHPENAVVPKMRIGNIELANEAHFRSPLDRKGELRGSAMSAHGVGNHRAVEAACPNEIVGETLDDVAVLFKNAAGA